MISKKLLIRANQLINRRDRISSILHGLDSLHVETTVGLVSNYYNTSKINLNEDAEWFHRELSDIEQSFKQTLRQELEGKIEAITSELSEIITE